MAKDISTLPKEQQLPQMLEMFKNEIKRALPAHISADRMSRIALSAFRQNPMLSRCEPASVFAAVIQSSQLGLEIGINGQAFLVPYKDGNGNYQAQFIPGWKGLVDLVNRTGRATVWTAAVYDGDEFDWGLGDRPFIHHKPMGMSDLITHYYAVGRVNKAEWPNIEVWLPERIERHRDKYNKVGKRHYSYENFEMYARKVVLLQVLKYLPSSAEMSMAIALNDAAEMGAQKLDINDAVDGTWVPVGENGEVKPAQNHKLEEAKKKVAVMVWDDVQPDKLAKFDFTGLTDDETKIIMFEITQKKKELKKAHVEVEVNAEKEPDGVDWVQMLTDATDPMELAAIFESVPDDELTAVYGKLKPDLKAKVQDDYDVRIDLMRALESAF